jgi:nucleotide-binding universal stress UspA family protein
MYKKIVIPLDGSNLAEQAILYLDEVIDHCPEVLLVSVTEKTTAKVPADKDYQNFVFKSAAEQMPKKPSYLIWQTGMVYSPGPMIPVIGSLTKEVAVGKMARTAEKYLEGIASEIAPKGFEVKTAVLVGDPAKEIVRFADEQKADLILMASTGGKPGLSRWNIEHIAEKVVETTKIPVMLVKPARGFVETRPKRHGIAS